MIFVCLMTASYLSAQESGNQKEIGIVFSNLDNFGLTFKTGTEKSLWRLTTLLISGSKTDEKADSLDYKSNSIGFGVKIGKEYRKKIVEHLDLRLGADLSFSYTRSKTEYDDKSLNNYNRLTEQTVYQPGINLVIGFNYTFGEKFVAGVEILPNFSYRTGTGKEQTPFTNNGMVVNSDISGFSYGISNTSALLSLSCRF